MSTIDDRVTALLASPSVPALIYALRHREVWPEGFEWDFGRCTNCAMGLTWKLWEGIKTPLLYTVATNIGLPHEFSREVFFGYNNAYGTDDNREITPEMVADELERLTAPAAP